MLIGCTTNQYEIRATGRECMNLTRRIVNTEEHEAWKAWTIERSSTASDRYNLNYIIREDFVPAAYDIDMQTIERFIFFHGGFHQGFGLVIDKMHGMVYYNRSFALVQHLDIIPFYAEFIEEDFTRLLQVIEESGLRDWQECYCGESRENVVDGGSSWVVGILFADGSILRRTGHGEHGNTDYIPPEFAILTNFVRTLGAEIIERHMPAVF